jgi:putative phosphoribosyl transferase
MPRIDLADPGSNERPARNRGAGFEAALEGNEGAVMLEWRLPKGNGARIQEHRRFLDRVEAGERLAAALVDRVRGPAIVLGIPRGGVIVAATVARRLHAPLDVVVPRKIGAPGNPELAVGAVAEGVEAIDHQSLRRLGFDASAVRDEVERQTKEVARRTAAFRAGRPPLELDGRTAVLVDDGIATGWTAVAAARWCRQQRAGRVVVAVPVGPPDLEHRLGSEVDDVVVLLRPDPYLAVGQAYVRFEQVSDEQVLACLRGVDSPD